MSDLTDAQRSRIIDDIINHESESRDISNEEYTPEDIEDDREWLESEGDAELISIWEGRVGEWVCSIGSESPGFFDAWLDVEGQYEDPAEWQLEKLLAGEDLDYGYNWPVYA